MTVKHADDGAALPLTRRSFLEQFGLVGGSALVMSAMRSWELMAAQAGPRPVLSGRPNGTKVIVLGAGVSGMTVGYELGKLGYDVRILEARDRVGGVNWTLRRGATHTEIGPGGETQVCNFDEGLYHNGGPWRLPHWHTGVLGYCKELGVPLEIFINENEVVLLLLRGRQHRTAGEQARPAARGEGRHDRLHLRADGQGDQPGHARHAADGGGQGEVRHLPRHRGLPRLRGPRLQEEHRAWAGRSARLPGAAAVRLRQPDSIRHRGHRAGADVPAGRRHGPVPEGLSAEARRQDHARRRDRLDSPDAPTT